MRPLRYSINVTLDGCCDHRAVVPDEEMHHHHAENLARADALLFGRVTYEMMEEGWRHAELVRGDLGDAVRQLKEEPGEGLYVGGVTLPLALAELGLIDEYELVGRRELGSGAVAMRYEPRS